MSTATQETVSSAYKEGFHDDAIKAKHKVPKGASHEVIDYMCDVKGRADWMRAFGIAASTSF